MFHMLIDYGLVVSKKVFRMKKKEAFAQSEYLHFPEVRFFQWCNEKYKINKGIYHTIDEWFYTNGINNIISRRIHVIAYLEYLLTQDQFQTDSKYVKFGNGGLVKSLNEFLAETNSIL